MATEDNGSVPSEVKTAMPERKGTRKRVNSFATFLKVLAQIATVLGPIIAAAGFIFGVYQFNAQQAANQMQAQDQQYQTTLNTYVASISDLLLRNNLRGDSPQPTNSVEQAKT